MSPNKNIRILHILCANNIIANASERIHNKKGNNNISKILIYVYHFFMCCIFFIVLNALQEHFLIRVRRNKHKTKY